MGNNVDMIGSNLLRYKEKQKYCFIDKEGASLNLCQDNLPWQLGYIIATKNEVLETANDYINWGDYYKISKGAAKISHYDKDKVKKEGKDPKEVYKKYRQILDDPEILLVMQNGFSYDIMVEKIWCEAVGEKHNWDYLKRLHDTSLLAKGIKKNIKPDLDDLQTWYFKMVSLVEKGLKTNLLLLAREYGIGVNEVDLHDALIDVKVMKQVFFKQIWEIEI